MIHGIHRYTADSRPNSTPTLGACLTELTQIVFVVTDLTDSRSTVDVDTSHFSRTKAQRRVAAFTCDDLNGTARTPCELTAFSGFHLHAMHERADWNILQWQRVAGFNRGIRAGLDRVTGLTASGSEDVTPLTVDIENESEMGASVGIVLDTFDATGDAIFVSLEVDDPIVAFMSAALMTCRDAAMVVAPTSTGFRGE
jgi:hypothetical protein